MHKQLQQACDQGEIRLLDLHLGLFLEKQALDKADRPAPPSLLLAATLASAAVGNGHVCYPLEETPEQATLAELVQERCPDLEQWRKDLLATTVVGLPGETSPLILDEKNRLYLYRFSCYEAFIAAALRRRAAAQLDLDPQRAAQVLRRLFPRNEESNSTDFQQMAAALALLKPLVIISGGPGTGKTHTVARILAAIQALHAKQQEEQKGQRKKLLRIALAAPTGKAAARLEESIRKAKLSLPEELRQDIPEQALTLHRLLGSRPGATAFRFNRENPLYLDLLILDEASMIDVEMMVAILEALPEKTRIILLGDRHQLASVEAGSLFADLCGEGKPHWSSQLCTALEQLTGSAMPSSLSSPISAQGAEEGSAQAADNPLADSLVLLHTSYRFQDESGIGALAAAVKSGSVEQVSQVIAEDFVDVEVVQHSGAKRVQWLAEQIRKGFQPMLKASSPEQAFAAMEEFRFLCALRKGPDGVEGINTLVTQVLRRAGLIAPHKTDWYQGRPIMILRNHYEMQLFNGDTGILWRDGKGSLRAWFRRADNSLTSISPARLPEHETAYALTIHKAQGSEFEQVLLLLPEEDSRVLSQELFYTGITRARSSLSLCASSERIAATVCRKTQRFSGLAEKFCGLKKMQRGSII
ncbi:MAG: exodeoxyribonuclease V subunit alpha [Candidatus Electrothrix sp. GW3-4]|uniref:exodeoxyribonuclease V subunit alpha n=1 Tax=Candidatus Electrothrix sp. GW3-4 TaxID=3126740 RepID=UPI0030D2ED06